MKLTKESINKIEAEHLKRFLSFEQECEQELIALDLHFLYTDV